MKRGGNQAFGAEVKIVVPLRASADVYPSGNNYGASPSVGAVSGRCAWELGAFQSDSAAD